MTHEQLKEMLTQMDSKTIISKLNAGNAGFDRNEVIYTKDEFNDIVNDMFKSMEPLEIMECMLRFKPSEPYFLLDEFGDFISMGRLELIDHAVFYPECF